MAIQTLAKKISKVQSGLKSLSSFCSGIQYDPLGLFSLTKLCFSVLLFSFLLTLLGTNTFHGSIYACSNFLPSLLF